MPTSPPKSPHVPQFPRYPQSRPAPQPGRHVRRRGRAVARPAWRALLLAGAVAAMLGMPAVAQAAATPAHAASAAHPARPAAPASLAAVASPANHAGPAAPASAVTTAIQVPAHPAAPGGICSVPGIGDIGGLLGFCAAGSSGIVGDLNNICQPSVPTPEPATGGIDALIRPPAGTPSTAKPTLYDSYGMAGQSWAAFDLQCSDMASLVGNNIAGVVFDAAKALDRVTITVYQSAAGEGILSWLTGAVDKLVTTLGNAIYFPYLAPVVILAAIWLAWQGLIRKRASRTIEGTLWMVVACAAAVWLIGRPADFTGAGKAVSDGISQALNVAFAKLPAPHQSSCVPVGSKDPQTPPQANFNFTSGNTIVDSNANELWTVLVCKPWLDGEFGTTAYTTGKRAPTVVNTYGRQLLWAQAIAANEKATASVIQAKEDAYTGLAASLKQKDPGAYALFQGKQWTTRLEIGFAALFAALLAGGLVLLIAITLILLKLGFLLLLVAGPFFLIVGTHPGFGRVIALRWGELLIGVLLKSAAIAIVLSVLLYAYSLIMGTSDAVLPWALKILMIALVTVAVFIYRKPFTHLFSAVGYGVIGSREQADTQLARAGSTAARNTRDAATVGVPGFAAYRAARWARRNPAQAAGVAAQVATAGATAGTSGALAGAATAGTPGAQGAAAEAGAAAIESGNDPVGDHAVSPGAGAAAMGRARAGVNGAPGRTPPPLDLPSRSEEETARPVSGWARAGSNGPLVVPSQSRARAPGAGSRDTGAPPQQQQARPAAPGPFGGGSHPGGYGGGHGGGGYSGGGQSGNVRAPARAASAPPPPPRAPASHPAAPRPAPTRRTAPPAAPRAAPPPASPPPAAPAAGNGSRGDEPPARHRSGCARCGAGSSEAAMELTSAQRKLVFAGVVVVLAALGAFLIIPNTLDRSSAGHGRAVGLSSPLPRTSPTPAPASQPTTVPGGLGSTPQPGTTPDIYAWLPFSQAGLAAAVDLVHKFAAAYASYTYTESTASYERQFNGLATAQLVTVLARGFATPGVAQIRTQQKQIATGSGRITAIRGFGSNNITFVVAITQKVTGAKGTKQTTTSYAVTVTGATATWQVEDLELASAGNT